MKIEVTEVSQEFSVILWEANLKKLANMRDTLDYTLTLQNLWSYDIYIEINEAATVDSWYKFSAWNEVEINYRNIQNLRFISHWWISDDIRVITT